MPETVDRRAGWRIADRQRRTRLKVAAPTKNCVQVFKLRATESEGQLAVGAWGGGLRAKG